MRKYKQAETSEGKKWFVELKRNLSDMGNVFPEAKAFEIGGQRIILPNGDTKFVFYSDVAKTFCE